MENHHFKWVYQLFLWPFFIAMLVYQRVASYRPLTGFDSGRRAMYDFDDDDLDEDEEIDEAPDPSGTKDVRPPRYLSWFITPITMVYGTYNYSYWGL